MIVDKPVLTREDSQYVITAICHAHNKDYTIWYKSNYEITPTSDIFLVASLLPAMNTGADLKMEGLISKKLYESLDQIQNIICSWFSGFKKINVIAEFHNYSINKNGSTASFFTAGVDSFYTLLTHKDEIKNIIFVHGFDIGLKQKEYRQEVSSKINNVSNDLNVNLIEVETNLRSFVDDFCHWEISHGAGLASVALLFDLNHVYIPASHDYTQLQKLKWGSHPELDKLWSTERTQIIHDECETRRINKIFKISKNDSALANLRVCWESGKYNCSVCEKCVRTMTSLYLYDVLHRCSTFDNINEEELADRIKNIKINSDNVLLFCEENFHPMKHGLVKDALKLIIDRYL